MAHRVSYLLVSDLFENILVLVVYRLIEPLSHSLEIKSTRFISVPMEGF